MKRIIKTTVIIALALAAVTMALSSCGYGNQCYGTKGKVGYSPYKK